MVKRSGNAIDAHVGARLRLRRMALGIAQKTLGKQLRVTFQQIQKYEKGTNRLGASTLYETGKALGVPIDYFFEGVTNEVTAKKSVASFQDVHDHGGFVLNRAFAGIKNPDLAAVLLKMVQILAETVPAPEMRRRAARTPSKRPR